MSFAIGLDPPALFASSLPVTAYPWMVAGAANSYNQLTNRYYPLGKLICHWSGGGSYQSDAAY